LGERLRQAIKPREAAEGVRILGPGAAPISRLRGEFRFHLQLQGPDGGVLKELVRDATKGFTPPEEIRWTVDVDPWDMQ
jgi:primosomal protein N' (replication factor Y)